MVDSRDDVSGHDPELRWGLKRSLITYVAGLPDGSVDVADGASRVDGEPDAVFAFSYVAPSETDDDPDVARYRGSLVARGYGDLLHVALVDPRIVFDGDVGTITIESANGRFAIAALALPKPEAVGSALVWADVPATLTAEGAYWLGEQYFEGQKIDAVTFSVPVAGSAGH